MSEVLNLFSKQGRVHGDAKFIAPLLGAMSAQASEADRTRSLSPDLIEEIKKTDLMRMSATPDISGLGASVVAMADELRAAAAHCTSTAWCLWNHLCVFHHFAGVLGPDNAEMLSEAVSKREWFCFPAGASSQVTGITKGENTVLEGVAAFGSGGRYADWAGVVFMAQDEDTPRFTLADLHHPQVRIDPTWDAMSLRASATDHIHYDGVDVPSHGVVGWPPMYRVAFRDPARPMIHHRYREDWVGLSVLWLGAMA